MQFVLKYSNSLRYDLSELFKKDVGIRVDAIWAIKDLVKVDLEIGG